MPTASRNARGGFTLIELMISLVLLGIVGGVLASMLVNMQRGSRAQSQRVTLQGNLRAGMAQLPAELRELSPADLVTTLADQVVYRAMRSTGVACAVSANQVRLRNRLTFGYRPIEAGGRDRLYLFVDGDQVTGADDTWLELLITGTANGTCANGDAATLLTVTRTDGTPIPAASLPDGASPTIFPDAPVRSFETMEMRLYESSGRWWLGARSVSGGAASPEPVLGPLTADGLVFTYLDRAGAQTATIANMRMLDIALKGQTDGTIATGLEALSIGEDSLTTRIRLRNAPSF
jgi:prepilin-type N-terminal cleavage/methylation domain-containing protein